MGHDSKKMRQILCGCVCLLAMVAVVFTTVVLIVSIDDLDDDYNKPCRGLDETTCINATQCTYDCNGDPEEDGHVNIVCACALANPPDYAELRKLGIGALALIVVVVALFCLTGIVMIFARTTEESPQDNLQNSYGSL